MIWNQVPFIRILFPFIIGICLAQILPVPSVAAFWVTGVACVAYVLLTTVSKLELPFSYQWSYGILLNVLLAGFAYILTISQSSLDHSRHFSQFLVDGKQGIYVEVLKPASSKENSVQVHVEVLQVHAGNEWVNTLGKGIVYLEKDTSSLKLAVGDHWIAYVDMDEIEKPTAMFKNIRRIFAPPIDQSHQFPHIDDHDREGQGANL